MGHQLSISASSRHVVGIMTGTSMDGIDVAMARIDGAGLNMRATMLWHESEALGELGERLRRVAWQQPITAGELARLAWDFGVFHAEVIQRCLDRHETPHPDLIAAHGQTVYHAPPISMQLLNPAPLAARLGCVVVCDLRQADLAAGGQGAPITPLADWMLFRHDQRRRAIVNLGGFCNVTILPAATQRAAASSPAAAADLRMVRGFDVCACNQLLDAAAHLALRQRFDDNGAVARTGRIIEPLTTSLHERLNHQRQHGRSLGTGDEATAWLQAHASIGPPTDFLASIVAAISRCIVECLHVQEIDEVLLAGGGARNQALLESIRGLCRMPVALTDIAGVPIHAREGLAMAVLGALSADGVPITLPQATRCAEPPPLAGSWTFPQSNSSRALR